MVIVLGGVRQSDGKAWRVTVEAAQVALRIGDSDKPMKFVRRKDGEDDASWERRQKVFLNKMHDLTKTW